MSSHEIPPRWGFSDTTCGTIAAGRGQRAALGTVWGTGKGSWWEGCSLPVPCSLFPLLQGLPDPHPKKQKGIKKKKKKKLKITPELNERHRTPEIPGVSRPL